MQRPMKSLCTFLVLLFLAAPLFARPSYPTRQAVKHGSKWDAVVVGAGLSGLTAAYRLKQANGSLDILVVDAMDHIGGRTYSLNLTEKYNARVSVGGTYALFEHHDTLALATELGRFPEDIVSPFSINVKLSSPELIGFFSTPTGLPLFAELFYQGSLVFNGGGVLWQSDTAKKLDSQSLEEWITSQWAFYPFNSDFTREFFFVLETYPDLVNVSALQCALAVYIRMAGIIRNGYEMPTTYRWEGGTGVFVDALVQRLRSMGPGRTEIITNSPVLRVAQPPFNAASDEIYPCELTIHYQRNQTISVDAQWAIMATSPTASAPRTHGGSIDYLPPLPEASAKLFGSMVATPTVALNILVVYKNPWWRQLGGATILVEYAHHVHGKGIYGNVVDATMNQDNAFGIVRIFCDSTRVEGWSEDQIKTGAIKFLKELFPASKEADDFIDIIVWNWNRFQPSLPGVTYTFPPTGVLSSFGHTLRAPHGRLLWAGSERSLWASGWMEGAVERGNDVAQELLAKAGWGPAGYDVRRPRSIPTVASGARKNLRITGAASPPRQELLQGFTPRTRLELAQHFFPRALLESTHSTEAADQRRISPRQWHDAFVFLHGLLEGR